MIENVQADPILIKRYAGRRLYNTAALTYVTPDELANMVLEHRRSVVRDVDTQHSCGRASSPGEPPQHYGISLASSLRWRSRFA